MNGKTIFFFFILRLLLVSANLSAQKHKWFSDSSFAVGDYVKIPVILFNLDKYDLNHPSNPKDSLRKVAEFLNKHRNLTVELQCHTDYRADNPMYSQRLDRNRANSCVDFLIDSCRISPLRIYPAAYGNSMPLVLHEDLQLPSGKKVLKGTKLTKAFIDKFIANKGDYEFLMVQNRRIQLKILRTDFFNLKTFNDSVFEPGDVILAPLILWSYDHHGFIGRDSVEKIAAFMKRNKNLVIEIGVHTDYRNDAKYNEKLSEMRAKMICDHLITADSIPANRVAYKGYGESKPWVLQSEVKLSTGKILYPGTVLSETVVTLYKESKNDFELLHQFNRRTELKVLQTDYK